MVVSHRSYTILSALFLTCLCTDITRFMSLVMCGSQSIKQYEEELNFISIDSVLIVQFTNVAL